MSKTLLSLHKVSKKYHSNTESSSLWEDLSLSINRGEFISIFGPNGCGKTTLLNIISGIDKDHGGVVERHPNFRASYVFQNYRESIFPWLTIFQNITFPLQLKKVSLAEQRSKVEQLCKQFSISFDLERYPYTLSGGQQQLVAILRALIINPHIILMDEPFSALDYETTLFLLKKTQEVWQKTGVAIVFVSHEVDDAILLAQKVIVLGKNPTRIIKTVENNLSYPREHTVLHHEQFGKTRQQIISAFMRGVDKELIKI